MDDQLKRDMKETLENCVFEIESRDTLIEKLQTKARAFDLIFQLQFRDQGFETMGRNPVWILRELLKRLEAAEKEKPSDPTLYYRIYSTSKPDKTYWASRNGDVSSQNASQAFKFTFEEIKRAGLDDYHNVESIEDDVFSAASEKETD